MTFPLCGLETTAGTPAQIFGVAPGCGLFWTTKAFAWDRAESSAEAAATLIPDDATPWLLLGRFQMRQEKFADAVVPLREAAKRAPDQALVQYHLGKALAAAGRRQEADESLRAALRGNPPADIRKEVEALLAR